MTFQTTHMTYKLIVLLLLSAAQVAYAQKPPQKPTRRAPPVPTVVLPPATTDQFVAAGLSYNGLYTCELGQGLQVVQNVRHEGYIDLVVGKQVHTMRPVLSSTGVLRLEDVRGRLLMLQVPLKSMLLDVQSGRRLADDCVNAQHVENRRASAALPASPGLGIAPDKTEAGASAAASAASAPAATAGVAQPVAAPASSADGVAVSVEAASAPAYGATPGTPSAPGAKP